MRTAIASRVRTLNGEEKTRDVPRLDGHGDVEVEADAELGEAADEAAAGADEVTVLDLDKNERRN